MRANRFAPWGACLVLGIGGIGLLAAGCRGEQRPTRIARRAAIVNIGATPRTLDPSKATDTSSAMAILSLTRGLTSLDADGNAQPELAESWTVSSDGGAYVFNLRPAQWSNGDPVTADDFVYTWTRRVLNPEFAAEYAYQLFWIAGAREFYEDPSRGPESVGVRALAPDRLEVRWAHPAPFYLQLVAHHAYFPVHRKVDEANPDWALKAETYVGCGPYNLRRYRSGYEMTLDKNPLYWNASLVRLDHLTLRMIEKESTAYIAFENGELDGTITIPRQDIDVLRGRPELRFSPQYATYFVYVNCDMEPFRDPRVRRALGLAIDRQQIVDKVLRAGESPALGLVPPKLYRSAPPAFFPDARFDEARRLLDAAGHPGGQGLPPLRYLYNTMEAHAQIAQVLQETWRRELGIRIAVENQEFKVQLDNLHIGNFDLGRGGWVADFADPINFLEIFDSKSENNSSRFKDAQYDALLDACRAESDPDRRDALLRRAESYLMERMPVIPIYIYNQPYLCAQRLKGYWLNAVGMFDAAGIHWEE
jgi:oligopeptide transport system substrate-binding protein